MKPASLPGPLAAAGALLGACSSTTPHAERYIPPPLGATWTWARRATGLR